MEGYAGLYAPAVLRSILMVSSNSREKRKIQGLCPNCGGPRDKPTRQECTSCREKDNARLANRRANNKTAGLCLCGNQAPVGKSYCKDCLDKQYLPRRLRFKERTKERTNQGKCTTCGDNVAAEDSTRCTRCRDKCAQARCRRFTRRQAGGQCVWCAEPSEVVNKMPACKLCWFKHISLTDKRKIVWTDLLELWEAQGGRCAYTGELLILGGLAPNSASIDHKVPTKRGGTDSKDNLHWVSWRINRMKSNLTHEEFIDVCKLILDRNSQRYSDV